MSHAPQRIRAYPELGTAGKDGVYRFPAVNAKHPVSPPGFVYVLASEADEVQRQRDIMQTCLEEIVATVVEPDEEAQQVVIEIARHAEEALAECEGKDA